jgi:MinD-like ATPase involved in chromosome partitioning or flagellar assembly
VLAVNLAFELAARGSKVCLVDLDELFPAIHDYFALPQRQASVLAGIRLIAQDRLHEDKLAELVSRLVCKGAALDYLSGFGLNENPIDYVHLERLISRLCERYEFVVLDSSANATAEAAGLVNQLAHRRLLVIPADSVGLARMAALSSQLETESLGQLEVVLNRAYTGSSGRTSAQLQKSVRDITALPLAAIIPEDQQLEEAGARGVPLRQLGQKSKALSAIGDLAQRLMSTL